MVCPECNGRGESIYYIETHRDEYSVTVEQRKGICQTCNGSGEKRQTNADRIRAMTDEELAAFLEQTQADVAFNNKSKYAFEWEKWLKQPADMGGE